MHKVLKCLTVERSANAANQERTSSLLVKEYAKSTACSIDWHTTSTNSETFLAPDLCGRITTDSSPRLLALSHFLLYFKDVAQLKLRYVLEIWVLLSWPSKIRVLFQCQILCKYGFLSYIAKCTCRYDNSHCPLGWSLHVHPANTLGHLSEIALFHTYNILLSQLLMYWMRLSRWNLPQMNVYDVHELSLWMAQTSWYMS